MCFSIWKEASGRRQLGEGNWEETSEEASRRMHLEGDIWGEASGDRHQEDLWEDLGLLGSTWDHLGSSGIIYLEKSRIIWDHLGAFGLIWNALGLCRIIWDHLGSSGIIWAHLGSSGIIWDHLVLSWSLWYHLRSCAILWSHLSCTTSFPLVSFSFFITTTHF